MLANNPHFYSLSPRLKNEAGHDLIYHQCVKKGIENIGLQCTVVVHNNHSINPLPENFISFFEDSSNILPKNFRNFFKKTKHQKKIVFLDTFSFLELVDLFLAFKRDALTEDCLWILLRYDLSKGKFSGKFHRLLLKAFVSHFRERLTLFSDSELIQQKLQVKLAHPIHLLPIPHVPNFTSVIRKDRDILHCWWPGPPRMAKGWDIIRQVASFEIPPNTKVILSASAEAKLISSSLEIKPLIPIMPRDLYLQELRDADVILLPYDPSVYHSSTSGILVETVTAGKIPLVRDGSWLACELRKFDLPELIVHWEKKDFWLSTIEIYYSDIIQKKLRKMQEAYRKFHSLENFSKTLAANCGKQLDFP